MAEEGDTGEGGGNAPPPAIELKGLSRSFGPVKANDRVSLTVAAGTIHGIVGENGAGKSTLMNLLYGMLRPDSGSIVIDGRPVSIASSADAIALGIGMVHQHFMLVPTFTVLENVMLGSEGGVLLDRGRAQTLNTLQGLAEEFGMQVDPHAVVGDLPVGLQQRVEIIKALKGGARILILDEPTGVLTPQEADSLFRILRKLRDTGVTVILITHKLAEIIAITDNVSIMRQGRMIAHRQTGKTTTEELAELMVGRKVLLSVDKTEAEQGDVLMTVNGLACKDASGTASVSGISFELRAGEVLGIAGVTGNGQSELLEALTGMRPLAAGTLRLLQTEITPETPASPGQMRDIGQAHIPEDRHRHGLVLDFAASENAVFGYHDQPVTGSGWLLRPDVLQRHCAGLMEQYDVRPRAPDALSRSFSGGNQQKQVIAREMNTEPRILIVGQPTRGVDIGAIEFIHKQIVALRQRGCAILLVSVELDEILALSDRIMVMNAGRQVGIIERNEADVRTLGLMMAGLPGNRAAA